MDSLTLADQQKIRKMSDERLTPNWLMPVMIEPT